MPSASSRNKKIECCVAVLRRWMTGSIQQPPKINTYTACLISTLCRSLRVACRMTRTRRFEGKDAVIQQTIGPVQTARQYTPISTSTMATHGNAVGQADSSVDHGQQTRYKCDDDGSLVQWPRGAMSRLDVARTICARTATKTQTNPRKFTQWTRSYSTSLRKIQ